MYQEILEEAVKAQEEGNSALVRENFTSVIHSKARKLCMETMEEASEDLLSESKEDEDEEEVKEEDEKEKEEDKDEEEEEDEDEQKLMKLICEYYDQVSFLTEDVKSQEGETVGKKYFIEGPFVQMNITNRNGRVYPEKTVVREVKNYSDSFIKQNRAWGELDHPDSPTVNLKNVSHKIVELKREGDNFIGKAELLNTPSGQIARALAESGTIAVSTRGVGSIKRKEGVDVVQDDFRLSTVDIVSDPSGPAAFVNGVLESKEWVECNGVLVEAVQGNASMSGVMDKYKGILKENEVDSDMEDRILGLFEDFLKGLS